jgi:hypothetical protein
MKDNSIDISKLKADFSPGNAPRDEKMIELLKKAYVGELLCHKALIKIGGIKPYSNFRPFIPEKLIKHFEDRVSNDQPLEIFVYPENGKFIMSDDYNAYYHNLYRGFKEMLCVVLGDPTGEFVIEKGKPFKLPPPSVQVIE